MPEAAPPSLRPYLIRALHAWCCDHGFTPLLAVQVAGGVRVPPEFVRDGEITLNISLDATQGLLLGDEWIEFKARFGGVPRDILVPVDQVSAIYARENGQGMTFPKVAAAEGAPDNARPDTPPDAPPPAPRPSLKRVK